MYIVNKTNTVIKLKLTGQTVELEPYGHDEVVNTHYLPEIRSLVDAFDGKIVLAEDITEHLKEKDERLSSDYKKAIDKASSDILRVIKYMSNPELRPATDKLVEFLTSLGVENPIEAIKNAGIEVDEVEEEELPTRAINAEAIKKILSIESIPEDKKLAIIKKIADYKDISYSPKAGFKSIADKLIK